MGLGPPVCTKCKKAHRLATVSERDALILEGVLSPMAGWWYCPECFDHTSTVDGLSVDGKYEKPLFMVPKEEWSRYGFTQ
jgi:hypothetical protein